MLDSVQSHFNIDYKFTIIPSNPSNKIDDESLEETNKEEEKPQIPLIFLKFINHFGVSGGFKSLITHLTFKALDIETKDIYNIPFSALENILKLLRNLVPFLNETLKLDILTFLKNEITKRFINLTEKDIKDIDKEFLIKILSDIKVILWKGFEPEIVFEMIESLELDLAFKFLICPYFEKRLKGIISINEIAERLEFTEKYGKHNESFYLNMSKTAICKFLTAEILMNWIKEKGLIQILLGDSIHIEILKRGFFIFSYFSLIFLLYVYFIFLLYFFIIFLLFFFYFSLIFLLFFFYFSLIFFSYFSYFS